MTLMMRRIDPGELGYLVPAWEEACECGRAYARARFLCTRRHGHDGDHAAHGPDGTQYARWKQAGVQVAAWPPEEEDAP